MKSLFAEGPAGSVYFDGKTITVTRKGLWAQLSGMAGKSSIAVDRVGSVRFVPARRTSGQGYIQFLLADDPHAELRNKSYGRKDDRVAAGTDPFSCTFARKEQPDFEAIKNAVEAAIGVVTAPVVEDEDDAIDEAGAPMDFAPAPKPAPQAESVADKLRQLAELHAEGILTDDEFSAKKAELLDRL